MADVEAKRTTFTSLLIYDVSRWGRFQDVDESAYYEYVLKRAGIRVHSSPFPCPSRQIPRRSRCPCKPFHFEP